MATSPSPSTTGPLPHPPEQVPPPPALVQDDSSAAEAVRQRLAPASPLSRILSFPKLHRAKSTSKTRKDSDSPNKAPLEATISELSATSTLDQDPIFLSDDAIQGEPDEATDRYQWAIVYENQRGLTLFSTPYYSSLSLLPSDPSAFTLPSSSHSRSEQSSITLATYPLPDGNWRWVSKTWMIDMRSESSIVQHDGFEYNWVFRRHKWRGQVGLLSAGGWVRRRRWIRLMMRPAKNKLHADSQEFTSSSSASSTTNFMRHSMASTSLTSSSDLQYVTVGTVWLGNEGDWKRCRSLMLRYGRDGRKVDLWRIWLGYYHPAYQDQFIDLTYPSRRKGNRKQWTEDDDLLPSQLVEPDAASHQSMTPPPREYIISVLQRHGHDLLHLFVYPDSRVEFLKLLGKASLLSDLGVSIGPNFSSSEVEFWSYTSGLAEELKHLEIRNVTPAPNTPSAPALSPTSHLSSDNERD